ncbi:MULTISPECIES: PilZ domain-containing protein [unclassified Fusibacter]|uniref:PilZ domain-containing protein n=1 Tax=unclassified Fusibacter TaxID=2624464 RepID=UPI001012E772|nr:MULTISPECIES: PilZ domain-containing protein [unclassified Fusibacter]MCK8059564.1 PilZ domain-containing protein [Fusibacter sp. A2]NPE21365.1 PilZ domain-containing protein [Fusibacter sp. A1]RXV61781.1 PilZ domain-containing protein [Fusibacter sp. A1]
MKHQNELRRAPRLTQTDHYSTRYTVVKNNVMIEKFVNFEMLDLSFQGMGVLTNEPLPVGALINFDINFDGVRYNVTARVEWTKRSEDKYRSGLIFEAVDLELIERVKAYLAEFADRRYHN